MSLDDLQKPESQAGARAKGRDALAAAKAHFEAALAANVNWRLLKASETGTGNSSRGVAEAERLKSALAGEPLFIAWQLVEAALAYLDLELRSAVSEAAPSPPKSEAQQRVTQSEPIASKRLTTALSTRIPTLTTADQTTADHKARVETERQTADAESTRFSTTAAGVEEAQVKIVTRPTQRSLIEANLPPLPLTQRSSPRLGADPAVATPVQKAAEADVAITRPLPSQSAARPTPPRPKT